MTINADLVNRLLALAGSIMEDASAVALIDEGASLDERIAPTQEAGRAVQALADAAETVLVHSAR
jgi:hypothetical protein